MKKIGTKPSPSSAKAAANFLFEVGILSKTPRSGFYFLGSGEQSVAEHINRTVYIGFVLASLHKNVDMAKVMKMCLFHDLAEARTSDLNYVHQKYAASDEESAINDLTSTLPFGNDMLSTLEEFQKRESTEAILAKDADNLEWILSLREEEDTGNTRAATWIPSAVKRIKTDVAKDLANQILTTKSDEWWFSDKDDEWWINRSQKKRITSKRY
ncbi:MAG: HD domain-containing protein [Candidatus Levybacteria bacterium]|nr:HD domain-containing protein [Candidatus Levybacteria bacterium]